MLYTQIYIYILFSLQTSRLFITCCYLVNFSCDLFFHATLTISRLNFKSISNGASPTFGHETQNKPMTNGHRWWRVKVEFDAARLCSRQWNQPAPNTGLWSFLQLNPALRDSSFQVLVNGSISLAGGPLHTVQFPFWKPGILDPPTWRLRLSAFRVLPHSFSIQSLSQPNMFSHL